MVTNNTPAARSKVHFGSAQTDQWPIALGGNIELDYMRFAAKNKIH